MAKVDWIKLKREYISDETVTYEKLSKSYGISVTAIAEKSSKESWIDLRKKTLKKVEEKLIEKTGEKIAEFQAKKLEVGKYMVDKGMETLKEKQPRNAREAKEVIEVGYKLATEAMELDKNTTPPQPVSVQILVNNGDIQDMIDEARNRQI